MRKVIIPFIAFILLTIPATAQKIQFEKTYISTTDSTCSLESTNQAVFSKFLIMIQKDSATYYIRQVMKPDKFNGGYVKTFCIILPACKKDYVLSVFERLYPFPKGGAELKRQ